jgi:SAM-dependent methyltransferase
MLMRKVEVSKGLAARPVVQAVLVAGFAVLAGLALFVVKPAKEPANRIDLAPRVSAAAGPRAVTTLRNITARPIVYTMRPGSPAQRTRTLAVGTVDHLVTDVPVEVSYDSGRRTISYLVQPGRPYSFRYDEDEAVRLYPGSHGRDDAADLAPYVPTPSEVAARMIEMAEVGPGDVVYDLGCGDGRLVIAAAKTRGARGVGIELDEGLLAQCREAAAREGVEKLVRFERLDAAKARIGEATVVLLYLLPESLETLKPLFERDLRPGARIVSHDYKIPGWDGRLVQSDVLPGQGDRDHRVLLYEMPKAR